MTDIRVLQMLDEACGGDFGVLGRLWRSKWRGVSLEQLFLAEPHNIEAIQRQLHEMARTIDRYRRQDARRRDGCVEEEPGQSRNPMIDDMPWCYFGDPD